MTAYIPEETVPAGTRLIQSYEYSMDVDTAFAAAPSIPATLPEWQFLRRMSNFSPSITNTLTDVATYDDNGDANQNVTGKPWTIGFTVQANQLSTGLFLPELEALRSATMPDARDLDAVVHVRYYHDPSDSTTPHPTEAFEGYATIVIARANTGVSGVDSWTVTLTGKGSLSRISNPLTSDPTITSVTPAGAAVGDQVTIEGFGFSGATAVTIDGVTAEYTIVDDTTIVAVVPTGVTGEAPVVVTTPAGTTAPFAYTAAV